MLGVMKIGQLVVFMVAIVGKAVAGKACRRSQCGRRLGQLPRLWEVSALSASVRVQRLRPLGHIDPGVIGWCIGLAVACRLAWGSLKQGKCRWFDSPFFSSIYRAVCGI